MANQALNTRNAVIVYSQETDGSWRAHRLVPAQGGVGAVGTNSGTDLDAVKAAARAAVGNAAVLAEHVVLGNHP
jgi:hypothetical protein